MDPTSLGTGVFKQWSPFAHASPTAHAAPAQQAPKSEAVAGAAPEAVSEAAEEHTRDSKTEEPSPKSLEVTSRRDPAARDLAKTIAPGVQTIDAIKSPAPVEAESIETADVKETSHRPAADSKIRKTRIFGADEVADLTGVRSSDRPETLQEPSAEILTQEVIDNAGKTLVRTDTALMNSQLLAYFIQQEFERHQHQPNQFALAIFDFRNKNQPLTHAALLEITKCLEGLKKPFDLRGQYRVREIAAFFPLSTDTQCQAFVEKAIRAFQELGISGIEKGNLKVRVGIASAADANDVLKLFASAARAKDLCSLNKVTSLCARDSRWEEQRALVKQAILKSDHSATEAALKACLEITEAFEPQDKRRVEALEQLGNFYFEQKKFPEAEPLLLKATRTREQMHGSTSLEFAASAYQLANCYYRLGKFQIAENLLRTAVNIQTNVYGPDHVIVGTTLRYLGAAYNRQHKYPETMACYDRALKILEQALGPGHSDTINMRVLRDTAYNNSQQASQNSVAVEQKQS
jgi:tetratricopeptide (TPR) repeat protein